jgi:hypothetical protein
MNCKTKISEHPGKRMVGNSYDYSCSFKTWSNANVVSRAAERGGGILPQDPTLIGPNLRDRE